MNAHQAKVIHSNPLWRYQTATGTHMGHVEGGFDHGGTDCGLFIRDCKTGEFSVVSGSNYKKAERIWAPCDHMTEVTA